MKYIARSVADLGHALRQFRLAQDKTQSDVAQASATKQNAISRIETGEAGRTLKLVFKLICILDLEIEIRPRRKGSAQDIEDIFS
ncbi:MAG: helix-turn-helix domain-containing protein [Robiginitomaculum sp.]|nr:helix-turn-helix domain-containing protein [Robiginitomaculum sp.]